MAKKKQAGGRTRKQVSSTRKQVTSPAARQTTRARRGPAAAEPLSASATVMVVGVGASAGGLEAFSTVLRGLPPKPGVAIVFVQHLAPQHESALVTLLTGQSPLPVVEASDGMRLLPDHVYVIPPNAQMVIEGDTLRVGPRPGDRSQYTPIDTFFSSLAASAGGVSVGVILSGTASDGALGVRDIKAAGGVTIVQTPESAKYDSMPRAAIATGMVDLQLAPEAIGAKLAELARSAYALGSGIAAELSLSDRQLHEIFDLLRPASGVDFRHYKQPTIRRRVFRRMTLQRVSDIEQYIRMLRADAREVRALYRDLLIHVTRFFREPESFEALVRQVVPALAHDRGPEQPIRAWVSGCATGEEAYSLAICLLEYLQKHDSTVRVQIFATDVSEAAVEQARAGVYPSSIEGDVSPERLRRFFVKQDGSYRVSKMVRDLCVFARQDLTKDPPFSRLDLILCRNVLIYMDLVLQKKLLSVFHYALVPDGFLVLGQAETVGAQATLFSVVDKRFRIHRKKPVRTTPTLTFPVDYVATGLAAKKPQGDAHGSEKFLQAEVSRLLMDRFAPPGVVVDSDLQIVQFRGQTGAYLEPAPGEASLNLLKMAKEGLLFGLRTTIDAARKSKAGVRRAGLQVRAGRGWKPVDLEVIPIATSGRPHFLVLFDDPEAAGAATGKKAADARVPARQGRARKAEVSLLERELAASREYLQSIIQELEAANEELQSANEEILSSNEELQSTNEELDTAKEELQSTNEELNTVNEELHGRNEELTRLNSDLVNLLSSVQIAIVIVGADLRIRRFTPMAEKVLNLIPADVDRQLGHIKPNIEGANVEQLVAECIETIAPIEQEVRDKQGRWYSLRIRPYRSMENRIDGAVVALFDIDALKRHTQSALAAAALAEALLQAAAEPTAVLDADLRIRNANKKFQELFPSADGLRGRVLSEVATLEPSLDDLRKSLAKDGQPVEGTVTARLRVPGRATTVLAEARACPSFDGSGPVVLLTARVVAASVTA